LEIVFFGVAYTQILRVFSTSHHGGDLSIATKGKTNAAVVSKVIFATI
jgi:hypothetical protein